MKTRGVHRRAALAAAVTMSALVVAGCDSHSKPFVATEPPHTATPITSASVSRSPSVAATSSSSTPGAATGSPGYPSSSPIVGVSALTSAYPSAAAKEPAAIQIVRDFFDGINHEAETGDETAVSKTFQSTCTRCVDDVVKVKDLVSGGHTILGNKLHLVQVERAFPTYATVIDVTVTGSADAGDQLDSSGAVVQHFSAAPPAELDFEVRVDVSPPVIADLTVAEQ